MASARLAILQLWKKHSQFTRAPLQQSLGCSAGGSPSSRAGAPAGVELDEAAVERSGASVVVVVSAAGGSTLKFMASKSSSSSASVSAPSSDPSASSS